MTAIDLFYFYQLVDPRDNLPFYVGQTISPDERRKTYLNGRPHYHSTALTQRLRELEQAGLQPIMQEIDRLECTQEEADEREAYWIKHLSSQGIVLLNRNNNKAIRKQQMFYLPTDIKKQLKRFAFDHDLEISTVVQVAIQEFLERKEQE
jgi:hypothetical protein